MPTANQLADALSPYLLQHRDNPVHWYPWGDRALALARELERPILLSIGYSACHWCHVMAHESFEDEAIARQMNAAFVNIKVDREERPDLDRIYQLSHQLLTGRSGGWPLTVFLDPDDLTPFFAGTYFPARPRHGMIAFPELLARIARAWQEQRGELVHQNEQLRQALAQTQVMQPDDHPPEAALTGHLLGELQQLFDPDHGGFGGGPKFPQGPLLAALAAAAIRDQEPSARRMLFGTLVSMARSGLRDHLGGGFFRYCVDGRWEIPHFEKMLYDNAQLLPLYAETAAAWDVPEFAGVANELVDWLQREMALAASRPEADTGGGFCSSLDADNEDGEGAYYVWTPGEVEAALTAAAATETRSGQAPSHDSSSHPQARAVTWFTQRYGLDRPPNFEHRHWHLVIRQSLEALTDDDHDTGAVAQVLEQARHTLLQTRQQRTPPGRDDKVIAGWNGLMIAGLCRAGRALERPEWCAAAAAALDFVHTTLLATDPPRAIWRRGASGHPATLDDHAAVLIACLEVLRDRFQPRHLQCATQLADAIIAHFTDPDHGGLYLTAHGQAHLLTRPAANSDDATPAGAGIAVSGLIRLGHLVAQPRYLDAAERALAATAQDMRRHPAAHATLITALTEWQRPYPQVLIGGAGESADHWHRQLSRRHDCLSWRIPHGVTGLPAPLDALAAAERVQAVVCRGQTCLPPVTALEPLETLLAEEQAY